MSAEVGIIYIGFRLLNTSLLFFLVGYVFKRYILDTLKEQMREQAHQKKALLDAADALERERLRVESVAREQELEAQRLQQHVRHWRERFAIILAERVAEKESLTHALARKSALQQEQSIAGGIADHVFTRSCAQARIELVQEFQQEAAGRAYVKTIVTFIQKSAS